jgi:hypothetical protein
VAAFLSGEDAKVDLNGLIYSVKRFRVQILRPRRDVSNTEGKAGNPDIALLLPGYESARRGLRRATVTLEEPSFDLLDNIFSAPHFIGLGDYLVVKIYPAGRAGDFHYFPSLQVEDVTHEGVVGEEQPLTITAGSDGGYFLYGEPKP